jgi:hypothetical protein
MVINYYVFINMYYSKNCFQNIPFVAILCLWHFAKYNHRLILHEINQHGILVASPFQIWLTTFSEVSIVSYMII